MVFVFAPHTGQCTHADLSADLSIHPSIFVFAYPFLFCFLIDTHKALQPSCQQTVTHLFTLCKYAFQRLFYPLQNPNASLSVPFLSYRQHKHCQKTETHHHDQFCNRQSVSRLRDSNRMPFSLVRAIPRSHICRDNG